MHFRAGKKSAQDVSINEPIDSDKDGNALTLMDTMAVDDTVIDDIDIRIKSRQLYDFLPALEPRERSVICMRYGLGGYKPMPQREVAKRLGISRSYISRIEKRALENFGPCSQRNAGPNTQRMAVSETRTGSSATLVTLVTRNEQLRPAL